MTPQATEQKAGADEISRAMREQLAMVTGGLAPDTYADAWFDWYLKLSKAPDAQSRLFEDAAARAMDTWQFALKAAQSPKLTATEADARFSGDAWSQWPFNVMARSYLNYADWWQKALGAVPGVSAENERTLRFLGSNALETVSPANYLVTNPRLLEATRAEGGQNLVRGFELWMEDVQKLCDQATKGKGRKAGAAKSGEQPAFVVGRDVGITPGKVVYRNELIELIQYSPATDKVHAEPILIVPAWIMKYYILDLSPANSMVRYLVSQGHTVFMVSWKNPDANDRNLGMDDYLHLGVRNALDKVCEIVPKAKVHTVGYCIGGTLLSIAVAERSAAGDKRIASMTLLAAQTDFSEPGELAVFISGRQLDMLDAAMQRNGVLSSEQMGSAFALLRSRDLLWAPAVNHYVLGQRDRPNDLMAWNADGTRMPCRMHSEYLRQLYLDNALAKGEYRVEDKKVDLSSIHVPMFVVGTETDHVAPWQSVYKARGLTRSSDYSFLLTSGGHNAGIVSGPSHPRRRYRLRTWDNATDTLAPADWLRTTQPNEGSWWPVWAQWLHDHSAARQVPPPPMGGAGVDVAGMADAPGTYVLQD